VGLVASAIAYRHKGIRVSRPRRLQDSGHAKSTEALARKLSAYVASRGFLDKFNSDKRITSFDPLCILAAVASDPRILREAPAIAVKAASEVATYLYPRFRPVEPVAAQATQVIVNGTGPSAPDHAGAWTEQNFDVPAITVSRRQLSDGRTSEEGTSDEGHNGNAPEEED
jgi:hypothetical protein